MSRYVNITKEARVLLLFFLLSLFLLLQLLQQLLLQLLLLLPLSSNQASPSGSSLPGITHGL
jgi:hypothetical protein